MSIANELMDGRTGEMRDLIGMLDEREGKRQQEARRQLVEMGDAAVPALVEAMSSASIQRRWESAKALGEIGAPEAAPRLARALQDDDGGVRWVAANALIAIGREGVPALLHALMANSESAVMRQGTHHVLRELSEKKPLKAVLTPVLHGLEGQSAQLSCLAPAEEALKLLESA